MLVTTAILLAILTAVMVRTGGTILFPPALFCAIWSVTLLGLTTAGNTFLPLSDYTCLVFLVGAVAFSIGGAISLCASRSPSLNREVLTASNATIRIALDVLLAAVVLAFPYYMHLAVRLAGTSNPIYMFAEIRRQMVTSTGGSPFGLAANLNVVAGLVATAQFFELDGSWPRRIRAGLAVLLTLCYSSLTGSKGGALILITLFFVLQVRARRIKPAVTLGAAAIVVSFFVGGLFAVNLSGRHFEGAGAAMREVGSEIESYWLGSPVAFGQIAARPDSLASAENIGRFFLQTGQSLGLHTEVPSLYAKYTAVRGDGSDTNTYTIYFSYFKDYGWFGMPLILAALAAALTQVWRRAMAGYPVSVLMYATMCTAILQSIFSETFFLGLNGYLKALCFYWAVYGLIPILCMQGRKPWNMDESASRA